MNVFEIEFPCLMKHKESELVVFFEKSQVYGNDEFSGIVVIGNHIWDIGEFSELWDMSCFESYNKSVLIKNKC